MSGRDSEDEDILIRDITKMQDSLVLLEGGKEGKGREGPGMKRGS